MSTPTATVRAAIKELLEDEIDDITVYPEFPTMQPSVPCIVMQQVAGSTREPGVGELLDETKRAHVVRLWFQFDVYHNNPSDRDTYTDKAIYALWENRSTLLDAGIDLYPSRRIGDLPADQPGERLYRKSFDFLFEIYMTSS